MKNIISKSVFAFIILVISVWVFSKIISSRHSAAKKEKAESEKNIRIEQSILDMVDRHNAVVDWEESFNGKEIVYSIQLEDALIRSDGRPILFHGSVDDVTKQENKYFVHFSNWLSLDLNIYFILECDSNQVKKIVDQPTEVFEQYAVVALISSIQRPEFEAKAYSQSKEGAKIIVESSDIFVARGRCLDVLFIGDYEIRKE